MTLLKIGNCSIRFIELNCLTGLGFYELFKLFVELRTAWNGLNIVSNLTRLKPKGSMSGYLFLSRKR